jgi:myo-inositol 2-dehydrogenase / D-chiro-inositol 1-dehydrogenase
MRIGLAGAGRIGAFHAATLSGLAAVDQIVATDAVLGTARRPVAGHRYGVADDVDGLLGQVDALVIPTFCEKPLASSLAETVELVTLVEASGVPVHDFDVIRFVTGREVVAGTTSSPCTVADALAAFTVAEACETSRLEGRPVALAEIGAAA